MELFGLVGLDTVLLIGFAVFYYKAADIEGASKIAWTGLSIIVSLLSRLLGFGLTGLVLGQAALFLAITLVRTLLSKLHR